MCFSGFASFEPPIASGPPSCAMPALPWLPHGASAAAGAAAPSFAGLSATLNSQLPPADIVELEGGGYLVVRRHSSGRRQDAAARPAPYTAPAQASRPQPASAPVANCHPADTSGGAIQQSWTPDQEQRYQQQVQQLRQLIWLRQRLALAARATPPAASVFDAAQAPSNPFAAALPQPVHFAGLQQLPMRQVQPSALPADLAALRRLRAAASIAAARERLHSLLGNSESPSGQDQSMPSPGTPAGELLSLLAV